jgi:hypothetical protein
MFILMLGAGFAGAIIERAFKISNGLVGFMVGVAAGAFAYRLLGPRLILWRFRKRLADRAISMDLPLSMELTAEKLEYSVGDVQQFATWNAVTDLFESHGYWIFLVQASPWFAPKRFFENPAAEAAFIADALAHMTDEAKSRSPDATRFVSTNSAPPQA